MFILYLVSLVLTTVHAQDCLSQFNTVGQCLDQTIGQMHQQTLDPNTRAAIDACFTPYVCETPKYDASNFGTLPDGLSSIGQGLLTRWFALPSSKRVCVQQKLYLERKKLIEDCYGGPVPDVGDNPKAENKGNAHRQALINVQAAQQACHTKLAGAEVTKVCVPNAYKTQNKANKCQIFQRCAQTVVSPVCISNFQNQYGKYCMCREKAYSQSITSIISFSNDLSAFRNIVSPSAAQPAANPVLSAAANLATAAGSSPLASGSNTGAAAANPAANPAGGLLGAAQGLFGAGASNLFGNAGTQIQSLFGGATGGGLGNILGGGLEQAKGLFGTLLGGSEVPSLPGGLTGLPTIPTVPNPGNVAQKASQVLTDCGINGQEFLISSQNSNLKSYCGCHTRDLFSSGSENAFCYVNCAQKGQTVKDIEQLSQVFQGQIEPRQEESFFCNGCF